MKEASSSMQEVFAVFKELLFQQFRTVSYMHCPDDHPNVGEVLKTLCALNYLKRLLKFGWDSDDGEIVAYADIWLMDGTLTQQQLYQTLGIYLFTTGHFFPSLTLKPTHSKLLGNIIKVSLRLQLLKPETLDFSAHQGVSLKKSGCSSAITLI